MTRPEPEIADVSQDDPEIALRKEQHRINSRRAHFWGKVSQLTFWAMTATLIGTGAVAGLMATAGLGAGAAVANYASMYISLSIGAALGATSLISSSIENRIRVDNSLNFEEIHAKNIGKHTGEEVVKAIANAVEGRAGHVTSSPAIPVAVARDTSAPAPQSRIATSEAAPQGRAAITLPPGVTLH